MRGWAKSIVLQMAHSLANSESRGGINSGESLNAYECSNVRVVYRRASQETTGERRAAKIIPATRTPWWTQESVQGYLRGAALLTTISPHKTSGATGRRDETPPPQYVAAATRPSDASRAPRNVLLLAVMPPPRASVATSERAVVETSRK